MSSNLREELHTLAEQLPEDATWDEVLERLQFRRAVAEGEAAAARGEFATEAEVRHVFGKYGVKT